MNDIYLPVLYDLSTEAGYADFLIFKETHSTTHYVDTLGEQKYELGLVKDPTQISHAALNPENTLPVTKKDGVWVYFPWKDTAVRILHKDEYCALRLSRNHNLITTEEQSILSQKSIAIAGLNVGNPGAVCLTLEGIGQHIKLADFDPLSVSNLNRFRAGLTDIGINKAFISARQITEIDPYIHMEVYGDGLTPSNIEDFLVNPQIDILIEEMDNLKLKIHIRELARKHKIPVVMVTGNGEHVLVDVERFDLSDKLPLLNNYLPDDVINKIHTIKPGEGTYEERIALARDFMGTKYLDPDLVSSFAEVGKTLAGIPQLAESSFLRGAAICHFTKHILLKHEIPSGRYEISLSGIRFTDHD